MNKSLVLILLTLLFAVTLFPQNTSEGFHWTDNGIFRMEGKKYIGENAYEKAFDWDAQMSFGFRALSYDQFSFSPYFMFQPIVAHSYDKKIRVSGQVYHLAGSFRYDLTPRLSASISLVHLSTHITQDIEHPFYGDLPKLPSGLLDDANVVSFGFTGASPIGAYAPWRWILELQPIDVALLDLSDNKHYSRPIYFLLEGTLWEDGILRGVTSAEGELGDKKQSVAKLEARLEFLNVERKGRIQIFANKFFAPHDVSSSPRLGFFPAEFAVGLRFVFETI